MKIFSPCSVIVTKKSTAGTTGCSSSQPTPNSPDYQEFWANTERGRTIAGEFKHIGKGGKEVWIEGVLQPDFRSEQESGEGGRIRH